MSNATQTVHPWWLRIMHWTNAIAVLVLIMSGWRIYNATAFLGFSFAKSVTLGGWLGGALMWHFAAMWVLGINGCLYFLLNLTSGRLARRFALPRPSAVIADALSALKGNLSHSDPFHYNAIQKLAYGFVMADSVLLVLSGLVLWKSVQMPILRELLFGYEGARVIHFVAMAALGLFVVVHAVMVMLVPRTMLYMTRGH